MDVSNRPIFGHRMQLSLMPAGVGVLTVEYKVNFLAPARGDQMIARGHVVKRGRTLMVCAGEVLASTDSEEKAVATMLATMIAIQGRPEVPENSEA